MAKQLSPFHKSFIEFLKLPVPFLVSLLLVKGKMGPDLTRNKRYCLRQDELLNPVKTKKGFSKLLDLL